MDLHNQIQAQIILRNNTPYENFLGLTPSEMHRLLYQPLEESSPVRFREKIENDALDRIPLFRMAEALLGIIQREGHIKLTKTGAMPVKVVKELYGSGFLLDEHIEAGITKLYKEESCDTIHNVRIVIEQSGLVRKANGKLTLTKSALKLLDSGNRDQLFKQFFRTFTEKFRWSYNDLYADIPIGQLGWGFSILLLDLYGSDELGSGFYAEKYQLAFPGLIEFLLPEPYMCPEKQFTNCYKLRTFDRFFWWFGFVTMRSEKSNSIFESELIKGTGLIKHLFIINRQ